MNLLLATFIIGLIMLPQLCFRIDKGEADYELASGDESEDEPKQKKGKDKGRTKDTKQS
jgi:hypothetical protein